MIGAVEPAEIPTLVLAVTGVVPLALLVRRHRAPRHARTLADAGVPAGESLVGTPASPFRKVDPEIPLLAAGTLFLLYWAGGLQVASGRFGIAGAVTATVGLVVAGVAASLLAHRLLLQPRGTVLGRIGMGLLVFWAVFPLMLLTFLALRKLGLPEQKQVEVLKEHGEGWTWLALSATLIAPVVEEACFRGLLYPALRQKLGLLPSIVLTSALFAAIHWPPTVWLPLAIFAAALAWLVETTGSVLPGIAAHTALNTLTVATILLGG